ncbi:MAG TPA: hypothetical protein VM841_01635 [Actinomycetota bacterium]|nr:hypothetical protein [Actinomycetota bacterium]
MATTVFLDWGLAFGAGVLFAIAGSGEVAETPRRLQTRAFRWGFAYLHLGVLSISLTLYAINPDWMWMYWVDPAALPAGIQALAFVLYQICFLAGFLLTAELARRSAWLLAGLTAAAIIALEITARTRLFRFGTIDEFRAGTADPAISTNPPSIATEFWLVAVAGAVSLAAMAVLLLKLVRRNPRAAPPAQA